MNNRKNLLRLLLFVSLSFVAVILNGQTVSKTFKNEALKTVLKEVEKQTGLSVIYKTDEVNENKMITATFKNASINDVLDKILDEGLIYKLQNKMIVISKSNQQKQSKSGEKKKISGTVVDENGTPIIGASVQIKGEAQGTITDFDGKFVLSDVPEKSLLTISYIGYLTIDIAVTDEKLSKITMIEDSKLIDEVVVVGYGRQKKESVVGAISSLDVGELNIPGSNISNVLAGQLAGVVSMQASGEPGKNSASDFYIRGIASFKGNSTPLVLVDGIERELDLVDVDDIATFSILKDASAASLYGSRAANGVILITTKQGKKGQAKVSFKAQMSSSKLPSGGYDLMNASEHYALYYGIIILLKACPQKKLLLQPTNPHKACMGEIHIMLLTLWMLLAT